MCSYAGLNNTTGSSNVYISNQGASSGTENNTIRIGTLGTGGGQQTDTYIAGIWGSVVATDGIHVLVDSRGKVGANFSSLWFRE